MRTKILLLLDGCAREPDLGEAEYHSGALHSNIFFFFQAEDGIRDLTVTGVQTCALPISRGRAGAARGLQAHPRGRHRAERSEEHTSELQSQSNLVCRLLLEKKNTGTLPRCASSTPISDRPSAPRSPSRRMRIPTTDPSAR